MAAQTGVYGPQTEEVRALLACASKLGREDLIRLAAAVHSGPKCQGRTQGSCDMLRAPCARAACEAAGVAVRPAIKAAALSDVDSEAAMSAVRMAATAVAARDSIGSDAFITLYTPWSRAMGKWWRPVAPAKGRS